VKTISLASDLPSHLTKTVLFFIVASSIASWVLSSFFADNRVDFRSYNYIVRYFVVLRSGPQRREPFYTVSNLHVMGL